MLAAQPRDRLTHAVAQRVLADQEVRDRLTLGIFLPTHSGEALARLEKAYTTAKRAESVDKKIRDAVKAKKIRKKKGSAVVEDAYQANIISREEYELILNAEKLRLDAIQVDEFFEKEYLPGLSSQMHKPAVKPFLTGDWVQPAS